MPYSDHHKRSIAKTVGFLAIVLASDYIVAFIITRQFGLSFTITFFSNLISAIIYFIHERAWNKVHWGKTKIEIDIKDVTPF